MDGASAVLDKYILGDIYGKGYRVQSKPTELCEIAMRLKVDKCEKIKHPYTPFYYDLFNGHRQSVKKVLELGVGDAPRSSLYMWRDFFPNAQIYGADNQPGRLFEDDRIKTYLCDQSSKDDLGALIVQTGPDIDIFIDDGSHLPEHQAFTCMTLMPLLSKDVIYIIEDVADRSIMSQLKDYDSELIALRHSNNRRYPDDFLIIVRNSGKLSNKSMVL